MKGMKGKLVKKLKSIPRVLQVKPQDRVLEVNASDGYLQNISIVKFHKKTEPDDNIICSREQQQPDVIDVDEVMRDLPTDYDDKENITPRVKVKVPVEYELKQSKADSEAPPLKEPEFDISAFRRPDLDSGTLFDPGLVAAFQKVVIEYMRLSGAQRDAMQNIESNETEPEPEPELDPLLVFEEKCPPGSFESVILYTTTLRDTKDLRRLQQHSVSIGEFPGYVFRARCVNAHGIQILDCKSVVPPKFSFLLFRSLFQKM